MCLVPTWGDITSHHLLTTITYMYVCVSAEEASVAADHWSQTNQMTGQEDDSWQHRGQENDSWQQHGQEMFGPTEAHVDMMHDEGHEFLEAEAAVAHEQHGRPTLAIAIGDEHAFLSLCETCMQTGSLWLTCSSQLHICCIYPSCLMHQGRNQSDPKLVQC